MKLQAICSCGSQVQLEDSGTGYTILEKFSTWQSTHKECKSKPKAEKKEWVGLTIEERNDCLVEADPCECLAKPEAEQLMIEIEEALRKKNT